MGKLLEIVITWVWENFLKSIFAKLDRWDVLFLSLLAVSGAVLWSYVTQFNSTEKLLWISFLIAVGGIWLVLRKVPWRSFWSIKSLKVPWLVIKILLVLMLSAGWVYARYRVYRVPTFPTEVTGFYVARFEGDPGDQFQNQLVDSLESAIVHQGLTHEIQVVKLPRVIGEPDAQQLGQAGGAALVLSGKVNNNKLKSYLTIVNATGVYNSAMSDNNGPNVTRELKKFEMPEDMTTMQVVLAQFFVGYNYYQKKRFDKAREFFQKAQAQLAPLAEKQEGLTPERATLGSINFYQGTTNYYLHDADAAIANYQKAISLTSRPADNQPLYIEPLNNLAFLLAKKGKVDEALNLLSQASDTCEREWNMACATVDYNLGQTHINRKNYQEGITALQRVISSSQTNEPSLLRVVGLTHKSIAFADVMMADNSDAAQAEELYKNAQSELDQAVRILQQFDPDALPTTKIVQSRIYIALKQYDEALKTLAELETNPDPNIDMLRAAAYACKGDNANSIKYIMKLSLPERSATQEETTEYFKKLRDRCQQNLTR